jgi:hypothetical protein
MQYVKVTIVRTGLRTQVMEAEAAALEGAGLATIGWGDEIEPEQPKVENAAILNAPEKKTKGKKK